MTARDRHDDRTERDRQDGSGEGSERRDVASSPVRRAHIEQQEELRDELSRQAEHQIRPEDQRPREAEGDRTGTARRAEEAGGGSADENYRTDAERAYRRSRGA